MDAEAMLALVIFAKIKQHFRGRRGALKEDVQVLWPQEFDSIELKSALLDWQVMHILKLVLKRFGKIKTKRPHATDGAVAHEMWRYHVTVK